MPKEKSKPHYLCCNADESEPGTFKDREIMRWTPHALIEGCAIATHAIQAEVGCTSTSAGSSPEPIRIMQAAARRRPTRRRARRERDGHRATSSTSGAPRSRRVHLRRRDRADELDRGPARQPADPAAVPGAPGVFGMPTTINNVETLTSVPHIVNARGRVVQGPLAEQPQELRHEAVQRVRPRRASRATTKSRWGSR